jgi:hypothetical protein
MSSRLITTSLVDSVEWLKTAPDSACRDKPDITWRQKAYDDLGNQLSRVWTGFSKATQRGVDFEKKVYAILQSGQGWEDNGYSKELIHILELCKGGKCYQKNKIFVKLADGEEYCLYGKYDILKPEDILDLKTTASYKGAGKYLGGIQHKLYCYMENISRFKYVVSEFDEKDEDNLKIQHVYEVDYTMPSRAEIYEEVIERVTATIEYVKLYPELWEKYLSTFCLKW